MNQRAVIVCLAIAVISVLVAMLLRVPLEGAERQFTALEYALRGTRTPDSSIVIVYVDNEAVKTLGWPVKRNFYALMVRALTEMKVRAVGIEPVFEDQRVEYPEYEDLLASVMRSSGNVVLSSYFSIISSPSSRESDSAAAPVWQYPAVTGVEAAGGGYHPPLPLFLRSAAGCGHLNLLDDGSIPLFLKSREGTVPAFPLELLRVAAGATRGQVQYNGAECRIANGLSRLSFSTGPGGAVIPDYPGPASAFTLYPFLEVLRAYDALRSDRTPGIPLTALRDKIVLVGVIAEGRSQFVDTPVDARYPSIVLYASFINSAIDGRFIRVMGLPTTVVVCLLISLLCAAAVFFLPAPLNRITALALIIAPLLISFALFSLDAYIFPAVPALLAGICAVAAAFVYRQREVRGEVDRLSADKARILAELRDREAKVALLERELLAAEATHVPDRTAELMEEIHRYKAEIYTLSSQADDMEVFPPASDPEPDAAEFEGIIYDESGKMAPVIAFVTKIAESDAPVLILGESGTGKELVARSIHRKSMRSQGPFVAVNCGALAENLLESELFGHEKGAFTGAVKEKPGRFSLADGGTIFLDEIGEVSEAFQLKLLRVLQEGEFERVGGTATLKVNVRILAATNKDLREEVKAGRFRDDLYYRLNVLTIHLPPLRERRSDIVPLVRHFLCREGGELQLSKNVMDALLNHQWHGNVRELESTVRRAAVLARAEKRTMITMKDLSDEVAAAVRGNIPVQDQVLDALREKKFVRSAVSETADELGGLNRGTVAEYLRGESLRAFVESRFDLDTAVHHVSLSVETDVNDRVRKRILEYLGNIAGAVIAAQPWEVTRAALKSKTKNLPQRYHTYLEQAAEAYYRGLWKLPDA